MLDQVLRYFPARTHALTLASDPDRLLADEHLRAALGERGFRVIEESDPIRLRYVVDRARPWTPEQPVVVMTADALNTLPYDLWQQGYHIELALHTFFPRLDYQAVRSLAPEQRRRLSEVEGTDDVPTEALSPASTQRYLLQAVFGIAPSPALRSADLVAWLDSYHDHGVPMSAELQQRLEADLRRAPVFTAWPLGTLIADGDAYRRWVRDAWTGAIGAAIREEGVPYMPMSGMAFGSDAALQALIPGLLRTGTIQPLQTASPVPAWAQEAVATDDEQAGLRQFSEGLRAFEQQLASGAVQWNDWQERAWAWAHLCMLRWDLRLRHPFEALGRFKQIQQPLDTAFETWLRTNYAPLAGRSLPIPHHLYHVPLALAQRRQQTPGQRQALVIMDGMALADWLVVRDAWRARHPGWRWTEGLVVAQVPSITAISRQALVGGRRPAQFADTLLHNRQEAAAWKVFWREHDVTDDAAVYMHLVLQNDGAKDAITSRRTQVLCLVSTVVDDMVHGASQGPTDVHASLRVWLHGDNVEQPRSHVIEDVIQHLLDGGFTVTLTSDHGHVGAEGIGQPQEGAIAISRGKRARMYDDGTLARYVHEQFPQTSIWHDDGLLPASSWIVLPSGRGAFAPANRTVVGHGGLTIEEMVVPLVTISQ